MGVQAGRDFRLYLGTVAGNVLIADMRETSFQRTGESVDVTTKDSNGHQTLLAGGGTEGLTVSGTGCVSDNAQTRALALMAKNRSIQAFGIAWGDNATIDGNFQVTDFSAAGVHNGEQTYTITLKSSGETTEGGT